MRLMRDMTNREIALAISEAREALRSADRNVRRNARVRLRNLKMHLALRGFEVPAAEDGEDK